MCNLTKLELRENVQSARGDVFSGFERFLKFSLAFLKDFKCRGKLECEILNIYI